MATILIPRCPRLFGIHLFLVLGVIYNRVLCTVLYKNCSACVTEDMNAPMFKCHMIKIYLSCCWTIIAWDEIYWKPRQLTNWNLGVCFTSVSLYLRLFRQRTEHFNGLDWLSKTWGALWMKAAAPTRTKVRLRSLQHAATASASSFNADVRVPKSYLEI